MGSANTGRPPLRCADPVVPTPAPITCAACVGHLADVEFRLLPEVEAAVVAEHLSECPDCRVFNEQLDITREILAGTPPADLTPDVTDILEQAQSELADGRIENTLNGLYRVASALGVEDADELVQDILVDAIGKGVPLDSVELINTLIRVASGTPGEPALSLNDAPDRDPPYDVDSETAELFFPEFYVEGPDVGRFVDSPNVWGHLRHVAPEDGVAAIELFEVAGSAVSALPDVEMRLITLVDIEGVAFEDAARALRVSKVRAARSLTEARIHVRGAIDGYLRMREGAIVRARIGDRLPSPRTRASSEGRRAVRTPAEWVRSH